MRSASANSGQRGASLIVVLGTLAVSLVTFAAWSKHWSQRLAGGALALERLDRVAITNALVTITDCAELAKGITAATACDGATALTLPRVGGGTVASAAGLFVDYAVTPTCAALGTTPETYELTVKGQRVGPTGQPARFPGTTDAEPPVMLVRQGSDLCKTALSAAPGAVYVVKTGPLLRGSVDPQQAMGKTEGAHRNGTPLGSGDCTLGATRSDYWGSDFSSAAAKARWRENIWDFGYGGDSSRLIMGYTWRGSIACDDGYLAVAGGADCYALGGYSFVQNGSLSASTPTADGRGWRVVCCGNAQGLGAGAPHPTVQGWVGCLKESGPS